MKALMAMVKLLVHQLSLRGCDGNGQDEEANKGRFKGRHGRGQLVVTMSYVVMSLIPEIRSIFLDLSKRESVTLVFCIALYQTAKIKVDDRSVYFNPRLEAELSLR